MDPPERERSISSGLSLPQWMKVKITERYDLEQTAFSPPTEDDSFFFLRYPSKSETRFPNSSEKCSNTINEVRRKISVSKGPGVEPDVNLSQHTTPCQQFILQNNVDPPIQVVQSGLNSRFKSAGVDDGFKTAACGKSVVEVANQMVNLKLYNGRSSEEFPSPERSKFLKQRRNSKSLPASPVVSPGSSPKFRRRNPFFTDVAYESALRANEKDRIPTTKSSGWISFSSFLNPRDALDESTSREASERGSTLSIADHFESMPNSSPKESASPKILRARPSELREMNFWSPTSM